MSSSRPLYFFLLVPDGSSSLARRAFLEDLLLRCTEELQSAFVYMPHSQVSALESQLAATAQEPVLESSGRDALDPRPVRPPSSYLFDYRRRGDQLLKAFVQWICDRGACRAFLICGVHTQNLERTEEEVCALLDLEVGCASRWAGDWSSLARCSFRLVGDVDALLQHARRPRLRGRIEAYVEAARWLKARSRRGELRVNILAPYEPLCEISQAVVDGGLDRRALPAPDPESFGVPSGSVGRSYASSALPLEKAHSQLASISACLPDSALGDFEVALDKYDPHPVDRGL